MRRTEKRTWRFSARVAIALPFREIPVSGVVPAPHQSRRVFDEAALRELADSIQAEGLQPPIVVRKIDGEKFELVADAAAAGMSLNYNYTSTPLRNPTFPCRGLGRDGDARFARGIRRRRRRSRRRFPACA